MIWDYSCDIEDIKTMGKKNNFCPYFAVKDRINEVDVIFMPYNYLIEENSRTKEIEFENSIIIFDEAHNVISNCEDGATYDIDNITLVRC